MLGAGNIFIRESINICYLTLNGQYWKQSYKTVMLWRLIRLYLGTYAFIYSCKNNDLQIEAINLKETKELYMAGFRWGRNKKRDK